PRFEAATSSSELQSAEASPDSHWYSSASPSCLPQSRESGRCPAGGDGDLHLATARSALATAGRRRPAVLARALNAPGTPLLAPAFVLACTSIPLPEARGGF